MGRVGRSGPGRQGRGGSGGHLTPLLSLEAAKEESDLVGSPSRMQFQLRQEDSAVLPKPGSISLHVFREKSNLLLMSWFRSLNMASMVSYT